MSKGAEKIQQENERKPMVNIKNSKTMDEALTTQKLSLNAE